MWSGINKGRGYNGIGRGCRYFYVPFWFSGCGIAGLPNEILKWALLRKCLSFFSENLSVILGEGVG